MPLINEVLIDGELANVSYDVGDVGDEEAPPVETANNEEFKEEITILGQVPDEGDAALLDDVPLDEAAAGSTPKETTITHRIHGDSSEEGGDAVVTESRPKFWKRGGSKKKQREALAKQVDVEDPAADDGILAEPVSSPNNNDVSFGSFLLNICTFGLASSSGNNSTTKSYAPAADTVASEEKLATPEAIVRDLTATEGQLSVMSESRQSYRNGEALVPSDEETSKANGSNESIVSALTKKRNTQTVVYWSVGIVLFILMAVLFIVGGILLSRNGW